MIKKKDTSLFDENGKIKPDVYFDCYERAVIKKYGSMENYENYLNGQPVFTIKGST